MIELNIQIKMIFFSFIYGIFIFFLLNALKKLIYNKNKNLKIISTFTLFLLNSIIYFFLLKKINNAIINSNLLITFFIGIYMGYILRKVLIKSLKH